MLKVSFYSGQTERGPRVIPLSGRGEGAFEKHAAPALLSEVNRYINELRPSQASIYVLVNAMGASEYYGSNINGDAFTEACLIHAPDDWTGNPLLDKLKAKSWPYGYPTFYGAHPFAHHRNKNPAQAYGEVELAAWNPKMHRVELVVRVDKDKCEQFGGISVWDKLKQGQYPDVSMGCFRDGTPVTMADGTSRSISEVRVGDSVLTHLGRPRRVIEVHERKYTGPLYAIRAEAHETIYCTRQHPWLAIPYEAAKTHHPHNAERQWRSELKEPASWAAAELLQRADFLFEPLLQGTTAGTEVSFELARLLGYYLADGYLAPNSAGEPYGIILCVSKKNPAIQEIPTLCDKLGIRQPTFRPHATSTEALFIEVYNRDLASLCLEHCSSLAKTKRLSEAVMHWPSELQLALLGAYGNGDGCGIYNTLKFSTASAGLSSQLVVLLARLGVPASVNVLHHRAGGGKNTVATDEYVVHIGQQWAPILAPYCYKVDSLEVKKAKVLRRAFGPNLLTPIREITCIEVVDLPVYNLEVEEDHSYQVDRLAVHNCKVGFDTCSICLDWTKYRAAQATFDPKKHKSPGDAVLVAHKALKLRNGHGIRGVSITRIDYCDHAKKQMNRILPDGRKIFVYNDYPKFFDISFVFIGADKTAKVMMKIAEGSRIWSLPSAELAEKLGYDAGEEPALEKTAGVRDELLKSAFGKAAKEKDSEIVKDILPSQFAGKAVPLLTGCEPDLPENIIHALGRAGLGPAVSTTGGLGIVLRPDEFERIVIISMSSKPAENPALDADLFSPVLARLLLPMMAMRSALGPEVERRVLVAHQGEHNRKKPRASLSRDRLDKLGAAYNGYRNGLMELVASAQEMMGRAARPSEPYFAKLAQAPASEVFTPLTVAYLKLAFMDERGGDVGRPQAQADVQRAELSRNTWTTETPHFWRTET